VSAPSCWARTLIAYVGQRPKTKGFSMSTLLYFISFCLFCYLFYYAFKIVFWHHYGKGEREAKAEFGRLQREQPDAVTVSEAEFVLDFLGKGPSYGRAFKIFGVAVLVSVGSCAVSLAELANKT